MASTIPPHMVRVAIYNEPNLTAPVYAPVPGDLNNNVTQFAALLNAHGFQATLLDVHDIYNNELITANYDVFALVDNYPRENITLKVQDFWLAGGSLLVFDSPIDYLCYNGILPPESIGVTGYPGYWQFGSGNFTIDLRHPVTRSYAASDPIQADDAYGYAYWDWTALAASVIGSDLTRIATTDSDANGCSVLAFNPTDRGGKIVTISYDFAHEAIPAIHPMVFDAVQWLSPRPKARIAFDLSHLSWYGIDTWDWDQFPTSSYTIWRNDLVSRGYLVDKLHPSPSGNLTVSRLTPYDTLIAVGPGINYTVAERTAVQDWIAAGGSLIIMGDLVAAGATNDYINFLLGGLNMRLNNSVDVPGTPLTATYNTLHPTQEAASGYYLNNAGLINYTGTAQPLWGINAANIVATADDHGAGRIILTADWNGLTDAHIGSGSNRRLAINFINWLSSATARVLVLTTWAVGAPSIYRAPLPVALNELGIKYYLTGINAGALLYFNLSMHLYSWDLIIWNNPSWSVANVYLTELVDYIDAGGLFIGSFFEANGAPSHPLWARLGMQYDHTFSGEPPMYIWDGGSDIFNQPINYGDTQFTSLPGTTDDGDAFTVFSNATALAGLTASDTAGEATLILRNDMQTLYNGYLIDSFSGDQDDSTYADNIELWMNEVAYMLRPNCEFTVNVPATVIQGFPFTMTVDIINHGLTPAVGGNITATVPPALGTTIAPGPNRVFTLDPGAGTTLSWTVETSGAGNFTITFDAVYHGLPITNYSGGSLSGMIESTPGLPFPLPWWWWIAAIAVIVIIVVVILVICLMRRKGSK
jgi:hypothetical protein